MVALPTRTVWRGNPPAVDHTPDITQVTEWAEGLETVATSSIAYIDGTLTALEARSGTANGEFALVIAEGDTGGVYERISGDWTKIAALPSLYTESIASIAAEAARVLAEGARDVTETYRDASAASATSASADAAIAVAAASASGDVVFYDTFADADAAKGGMSEGQIVEVHADEANSNKRTRYALESAVLVLKYTFDSALTDVPFIPSIEPAFATAFRDGVALDPKLTFSRDAVTTRRGAVGFLESVAANVPAHQFDFAGAYQGIAVFPEFAQELATAAITDMTEGTYVTANAVVVSDAIAGPDGVTMADKVRLDVTPTTTHSIRQDNEDYTLDQAYTVSFFAKAGELSWLRIAGSGTTPVNFAPFHVDLVNGTLTDGAGGDPADDIRLDYFADGWVRISISFVQDATTSTGDILVQLATGGASADTTFATADGSSGVYLTNWNRTPTPIAMPFHPVAETRPADLLAAVPAAIGHRDTEGAAVVEYTCTGIVDHSAPLYYGHVDSASTHGVSLYADNGTSLTARWRDGSEDISDGSGFGAGFDANARAGMTWGESGLLAMTPTDMDVTPSAGTASSVATEVRFGQGMNSGADSNDQALSGYIRTIAVWSREIQPSELRNLVERGYVDQRASRLVSPDVISVNRAGLIRASDIVSGDIDTAEKAAAMQAAVTSAAGRAFEWNVPYGQASRPYNITDRSLAGFIIPRDIEMYGAAGAPIDMSACANSGTLIKMFTNETGEGSQVALTVDGDIGDASVTVGAGGMASLGLAVGDQVHVGSRDVFIAGGAGALTFGSPVSVVAGETLTQAVTGATAVPYYTESGVTFVAMGTTSIAADGGAIFDTSNIVTGSTSGALGVPTIYTASEARGEVVTVAAVGADNFTPLTPLQDNYAMGADAYAQKIDMGQRTVFSGVHMVGCGQFTTDVSGDRGYQFQWLRNLTMEGVETRFFDHGNRLMGCIDFLVSQPVSVFQPAGGRTSHQNGLGIFNACQNGVIRQPTQRLGGHGVVQNASGTAPGVTRDVTVEQGDFQGLWQAPVATHQNAERWNFRHNVARGGVKGYEFGCRSARSEGNEVHLPEGSGDGFFCSSVLERVESRNDKVFGGARGFRLDTDVYALLSGSVGPTKVSVKDFRCEAFATAGVLLNSSEAGPHDHVQLQGITTRDAGLGGTSPPSIKVTGPFEKVIITDCDLHSVPANNAACILTTGISGGRVRNVDYSGGHATPSLSGTDVTSDNIASF